MANTTENLDIPDAFAAAMKKPTQTNAHRAFPLEATTAKLREESRDMEASIEATLAAQSRVEAAVTAMVRRAEYLESKVKAMDEEKERVDKKIEAFEQGASRAVCFSIFGQSFDVSSGKGPSSSSSSSSSFPSSN